MLGIKLDRPKFRYTQVYPKIEFWNDFNSSVVIKNVYVFYRRDRDFNNDGHIIGINF